MSLKMELLQNTPSHPHALQLDNTADVQVLELQGISLIELKFPKFTDGRAFSQAHLLRRRGYAGDLRATGDVRDRNVVGELLNPSDVDLAHEDSSDDFVVSQKLVSLLLAQLGESPHLAGVFDDLFTTDGATIALQPFERFAAAGVTTFGAVVAEARNWGTTAIGYRAESAQIGRAHV